MAIISCPECQSAISDQAKSCPQCGYVLKKKDGCGLIFLGLIALVAVFIIQIDSRSTSVPASSLNHSSKSNSADNTSTSPSGLDYSTLNDNHPAWVLIGKPVASWHSAPAHVQGQAAELIVERARTAKVLKPAILEKISQYEGMVWARNEMLDGLNAATKDLHDEGDAKDVYQNITISDSAIVLMSTMGWIEKN